MLQFKNIWVSQDSRAIQPGEYYVAVKGENFDGHKFSEDALKKGAAGILEEKELYKLAKRKLRAFKPLVIGITGSTGKTTTKEAIATVLSEHFIVCSTQKNHNTRLGIAMDIMNCLKVGDEIFVVEMGMDRAGEIAVSCNLTPPEIAIVTSINETHLEKLGNLENIIKAKGEILEGLRGKKVAILNMDDVNVMKLKDSVSSRKVYYSINSVSNFRATDIKTNSKGTSFTLNDSSKYSCKIPGRQSVYTGLCAIAVASVLKMDSTEIKKGLRKIKSAKGRLNIIAGANGSTIIDDTYNASPVSTAAALDVLSLLSSTRKIVIMGDMLELGSYEKEGHKKVVEAIKKVHPDIFITVGPRMRLALGKPNNILNFGSSDLLKSKVYDLVAPRKGDLILVKGSQGIRMEKVVYELMRDKAKVRDLLVRQDASWTQAS